MADESPQDRLKTWLYSAGARMNHGSSQDENGNWYAQYVLPGGQTIVVMFIGKLSFEVYGLTGAGSTWESLFDDLTARMS